MPKHTLGPWAYQADSMIPGSFDVRAPANVYPRGSLGVAWAHYRATPGEAEANAPPDRRLARHAGGGGKTSGSSLADRWRRHVRQSGVYLRVFSRRSGTIWRQRTYRQGQSERRRMSRRPIDANRHDPLGAHCPCMASRSANSRSAVDVKVLSYGNPGTYWDPPEPAEWETGDVAFLRQEDRRRSAALGRAPAAGRADEVDRCLS